MSPGGAIFVPSPWKTGTILRHPRPPQSLNDSILLSRIAAPLVAVAGTGAGEDRTVSGDALPSLGVDAPPNKGSLTSPAKGSAGAIKVARLLLTLSSDVMATDDEVMTAFSTGSSSFAILNV